MSISTYCFWLSIFILVCLSQLGELDDYSSTYGWRQRTSQDHQLPPTKPPSFSLVGFVWCLFRTILLWYWRFFLHSLSQFRYVPAPAMVEHKGPKYHYHAISQIVDGFDQRFEARMVHSDWIQSCTRMSLLLERLAQTHLSEWQQLLYDWNTTYHQCDYSPAGCHILHRHQYQLTNQSLSYLYPQQIIQVRQTMQLYHAYNPQFSSLVDYLNKVYGGAMYETDRWMQHQLRRVQRDVYLQVYNAMHHGYSLEPHKIKLDTSPLSVWWVKEMEETIPWYLYLKKRDTCVVWQLIVVLWHYLLDYLYFCLDRFNQTQTSKLLWKLDFSLEQWLRT